MIFDPMYNEYNGYQGLAVLSTNGYNSFLHGTVVDMLYFPVIKGNFPVWFPFWGGEPFEFFRPIFNLADAAISGGVITILVFQRFFFKHKINHQNIVADEMTDNTSAIS
jgi:signal peptidase II